MTDDNKESRVFGTLRETVRKACSVTKHPAGYSSTKVLRSVLVASLPMITKAKAIAAFRTVIRMDDKVSSGRSCKRKDVFSYPNFTGICTVF